MSTTQTNQTIMNGVNTNARAIQSLLDDNKEQIPSGLYKDLCDAMMKLNTAERQDHKDFYRVHYVYSSGEVSDDPNIVKMNVIMASEIIQLPAERATYVVNEIERLGGSRIYRPGNLNGQRLTANGKLASFLVPVDPEDVCSEVGPAVHACVQSGGVEL